MKRILSEAIIAIASLSITVPEYAKGFSSGRSSFSSPSRSYSSPSVSKYWGTTPKPAPAPQKNVTINRSTTIVQQSAPSSSGSGFFGSFLGSVAGVGIGNWLFAPKPAPPAAPQVIDCAKQPLPAEWAPHCLKQ